MSQSLFVANSPILKDEGRSVNSEYVELGKEAFYKISNYDQMSPFFMTVVSHSDHWLFISSTGGITAGRKNENSSLFPYYTDDKISDSFDTTGSKSIFRVKIADKTYLWEPFSKRYQNLYKVKRNLLKSISGNKIVFEEINEDLKLKFQYSWQFSDKYGFVKKSSIENFGDETIEVNFLDGLQNLMPYGVESGLQNERSNLVNAYKKNELIEQTGLALILLSAIIVDRAEPSEALKATTVWSSGIDPEHYLLSGKQLNAFRLGENLKTESNVKAEAGAYFINKKISLKKEEIVAWQFIAELNQDSTNVNDLNFDLRSKKHEVLEELENDIVKGTEYLRKLVAAADGIQMTNDKLLDGRHYTNVLFNIMRGGIFDNGYLVNSDDFKSYFSAVNKQLFKKQTGFLEKLPDKIHFSELLEASKKTGDLEVVRMVYDYLPLTFSRRHGDPSRPWNKFSIETRKEDGSKNLDYQGNWRDIFQNWEALAVSYPGYINSMISKFLNASTMDGYNPYRIMREGIDWEVIEPNDPWSYIGYWGDHQIIYLLKLLEISFRHSKSELEALLDKQMFVYANVPYLIKSYNDILRNPKDTIVFDEEKEASIEEKVEKIGSDGKMVFGSDNELIKANLAEKILLTFLTKMSNFIPEGGIWLNTQRPEWNDANNALVGNGVSMVTLYYMRRYAKFCIDLFENTASENIKLHEPIAEFLRGIHSTLIQNKDLLKASITDQDRRQIVNLLGITGEQYRQKAYSAFGGTGINKAKKEALLDFFKISAEYIDHSIAANKREDGLYHSYNLLDLSGDKASISHLYEMLEGQVGILTSGVLESYEVIQLLDHLEKSQLFREDQYSYLLYPNRELPGFLEKNNIPDSFIKSSELAQLLIKNDDRTILTCDKNGTCHFNGNFTNAMGLKDGLQKLKNKGYDELLKKELNAFLDIYEDMFNHKAFTGRSGTFFGYEGLGSIYWHMVSKLLLAIQENLAQVISTKEPSEFEKLKKHYYKVREGIGLHKSPALYGAFPSDAYSHTPQNKGAQQPGMTGQVKEDILNRWAELGLKVKNAKVRFEPKFLDENEFLDHSALYEYFNVKGELSTINLNAGELAFTYCQVPVIYSKSTEKDFIQLIRANKEEKIDGLELNESISAEIFNRSNQTTLIRVHFKD
ncbi:MAG: hypothetical protein RLN79_03040 [Cytophagales bacterium]